MMNNPFNIIQSFFTTMRCNHCDTPFEERGIELLQEQGNGLFVVSVYCHHCQQQVGVAMVGLEGASPDMVPGVPQTQPDPEFTEEDMKRLSNYDAISDDDVLDAHEFFSNLKGDWTKHVPTEVLQRCTKNET